MAKKHNVVCGLVVGENYSDRGDEFQLRVRILNAELKELLGMGEIILNLSNSRLFNDYTLIFSSILSFNNKSKQTKSEKNKPEIQKNYLILRLFAVKNNSEIVDYAFRYALYKLRV